MESEIPIGWKPDVHGFIKRRGRERNNLDNASRFLFVANVVPHGQTPNVEIVEDVFGSHGDIVGIYPLKDSPFVNVWFEDVEDAKHAMENLNRFEIEEFGNRKINIEFCEPRPPPGSSEVVPDFVNLTAHVPLPAGLYIIENFISEKEEALLLEHINSNDWINTMSRSVQHYGYVFDYTIRGCDPSKPIGSLPDIFFDSINITTENSRNTPEEIRPFLENVDQATVNEYLCGQGIRRHTDNPEAFHDGISSLSLASPIIMCFQKNESDIRKSIVLRPRSLLILTGESRYHWTHCIRHRKIDIIDNELVKRKTRVSITFRTINQKFHVEEETNYFPTELEMENVHKVYEAIAPHFSSTRHSPWPQVSSFLKERVYEGCLLVDLGCGNGKYLKILPPTTYGCGFDRSSNLINICAKRGMEVLVGDALMAPYRDNCADITISIAVLHHFSTVSHRLRAIEECIRLLKPGGYGLICAWAKEQKTESRHQFSDGDVLVPWNLKKQYTHNLTKDLKEIADENNDHLTYQRYCHVYKENELEQLVQQVGGNMVEVLRTFFDEGNWCVEFRKFGGEN